MIERMRHAGLAAVLLAACGGKHTGPALVEVVTAPPDAAPEIVDEPVTSDVPVDFAQASWKTDDEALALWRALELTGDNYQLRLGDIPAEPGQAMAKALLRQGGFEGCATTKIPLTCTQVEEEFLEVEPDATIDDPCLRRRLALWSLDQLSDDTLREELVADVVALAGLPPPETELNRAVLYRVAEDEALRLQMIQAATRAGNGPIAAEALGGLSTAGLEAAAALHLDDAVEALYGSSTSVLGAAALDPLLRRDTRVRAARELGYYALDADPMDPNRQAAIDAIRAATKADDCAVAGAAGSALSSLDHQPWPPALPKNAKAPAVLRRMCTVIYGDGDEYAMWAEVVGEAGVTIRRTVHDPMRVKQLWEENPDAVDANKDGAPDVDDADPDGDGDPATTRDIVHLDATQWVDDATNLEEVRRALPECKGLTCRIEALRTDYTFHFRKTKQGLQLDALDIDETAGGC